MSDEEREKYPSELAERFQVRMPSGLRDRIREAAETNNRSMNAEIVARIEDSFRQGNAALLEATLVAESLRENLTQRIENYERLSRSLLRREQELQEREEKAADIVFNAEVRAEEILEERRNELESNYQFELKMLERKREQVDEYAGFTIARERQFYEAIKAITGKEPPDVDPIPPVWKRIEDAEKE